MHISDFVLSDYVQRTLLQRRGLDRPIVDIKLTDDMADCESWTPNQSNSYLIMVDLSVRSDEDLIEAQGSIPFLKPLLKKLKASGQSIAADKFLHVHDVGTDDVCHVGIARLPLEMYVSCPSLSPDPSLDISVIASNMANVLYLLAPT